MPSRVEQTLALDSPVQNVRFAHGKRLEGLQELGVITIRDLLEHYPFRYDDFSKITRIIDLTLGQKQAVLGRIHEAKGRKTARGGFLFEITLTDDSGTLRATWFNQRWLADILTVGKEILLLGRVEHYAGLLSMASPLYTLVSQKQSGQSKADESNTPGSGLSTEDRQIENADAGTEPVGIVPVYRANAKISSNWIKRLIIESLKLVIEPLDPLPPLLRSRRRLVSRQIAWHNIHIPPSNDDLISAHSRLAYEQVFWQQLHFGYSELQQSRGLENYLHSSKDTLQSSLVQLLPFTLTNSQQRAIEEIQTDMQSATRMNRLLLGDVGSGKTVVALHALLAAAQNGWQAAMMAPTEVLAHQYAQAIGGYLDELNVSWALLTSSTSAKERKKIVEEVSLGTVQILLGTHALIEPDVCFKELSLIVIDEQHRFGVEHRSSLREKSPSADYLCMTATPIPRSLALVLYGNVSVSYLQNRPSKANTATINLDSSVAYKAYEAIREALSRGEQAYIVCPLISAPASKEEDEISYLDDLDGFFDEPFIAAAESELEHLRTQVFPSKRIELLTSRVKSEDKQRIMTGFKAAEVDILVSTTVIEVGVDVPNATVMMILDADRFGLAQLHQLRGRVGRGSKDAQVFLVSSNPGDNARRRLRLLERYNDGLKLAEADLAGRQEGDIAGTRQHGASSLSLIQLMRDGKVIEAAHKDVAALLDRDPELTLPENQHLVYELLQRGRDTRD